MRGIKMQSMMVASVLCEGPGLRVPDKDQGVFTIHNRFNQYTPCEAYQQILDRTLKGDPFPPAIIIYAHDDLTLHDPDWLSLVRSAFNTTHGDDDPNIVAVGLGGATGLGNRDLYRKPFNIWNMARTGYASNQTDAETHGERFTSVRRVAVLDAFFMAVRTDWLQSIEGWPVKHLTHHCLDLWLACEAARAGKEIWMTGVSCTHHGGGTSTKPTYAQAKWLKGGSLEQDHIQPHRWLYEEYRDVLPIKV